MGFNVVSSLTDFEHDALILSVRPGVVTSIELSQQQKDAIAKFIESGDFEAKAAEVVLVNNLAGFEAKRIILFGLGEKTSRCAITNGIAEAVKLLSKTNAKRLLIAMDPKILDSVQYTAKQIIEAFNHSKYQFKRFKTLDKVGDNHAAHCSCCSGIRTVAYAVGNEFKEEFEKGLIYGTAVSHGIKYVRDLGNLPSNICTPDYLGEVSAKIAETSSKLSVSYLNPEEMEKLGMNLYLAVAAGAKFPALLTQINYQGTDPAVKPVVLVGKAMTFDTGGYSVKPAAGMEEMKYDMLGGATVIGVMKAISELNLPINVIGFVCGCENAIDAKAYKPGDILTSLSGITVEIGNTDAEGRLVLADTLTYVKRFDPAEVIDIATLTGAVIIALGRAYTGVFSSSDDFAQQLIAAGKDTGDYGWHLPVTAPYKRLVKGNHADLTNSPPVREAGSSQAAAFLSYFTKDYKWAHLDIAATGWKSGDKYDATGRPVTLLTEYLVRYAKNLAK